jgi:hypothetical protein
VVAPGGEPEHPVEHQSDGGPPEPEPFESVGGRQPERPLGPEDDPGGDRLGQGDGRPDRRDDPRLPGQDVVRRPGQYGAGGGERQDRPGEGPGRDPGQGRQVTTERARIDDCTSSG